MFKKITLWLHIFLQVPYLHYFLSLKTPLCVSPSPSDQLVGSGQGIQLRSMHEIQRGGPENSIMMYMHACVLSHFSCVWLFVTLACQAPLSVGFPRQEYWSGLPFPPSGNLPGPGMEPLSLMSPELAEGLFFVFYHWATREAPVFKCRCICMCVCVLLRSNVGWWIKYKAWNILF